MTSKCFCILKILFWGYMMKIDRLLAIITILLQKEKVTAPELAKRLEVSRRTISRDIDDICMAGIPVVTKQGGDGGIYIAEGYKLDKSILTREELQDIITGLNSLDSISNSSNIERLLDKLSPEHNSMVSLKNSIMIDLSSHYKTSLPEKITHIKNAIGNSNVIAFDYYSQKGKSRREIEPYFIVFRWADWYVYGFCLQRNDFRLFKLNRLWRFNTLLSSFVPRDIPEEVKDLDAHLINDKKMIIKFDKEIEYILVEEYGPDSYKVTNDNKLYFEESYTNRDNIIRWILGFGDKAEVISPQDLIDEIKMHSKNMLDRYNG